jgi:hypothetical protein
MFPTLNGGAQSSVQNAFQQDAPSLSAVSPEAPLWVRDLRRAEIVAIGSFPFTYFLATFSMDTYRSSAHEWDRRYAPWPLKAAGAVDMTKEEHLITIGIATAGSILVSLTDFIIVWIERSKREKEIEQLPQGSPIIIRKPWPAGDTGNESPDNISGDSGSGPGGP